MQDDKLAADEHRRVVQHERVKARVEEDVTDRIASKASHPLNGESVVLDDVADQMRGRAIRETVQTEREVERARGAARGSQVVDYIFYIVYTVLAARFVLTLLDANTSSGFVQFVHAISDPFYRPFHDVVRNPSADGFTFSLSILIALAAYMVLHMGINGLLRMLAHRKTAI